MEKKFKSMILDCTIRDGGYYNSWDFDKDLFNKYIELTNLLPIDYVEIGYRGIESSGFYGLYYYLPDETLQEIRLRSNKKIAIMIDLKSINSIEHLKEILMPCSKKVDLIRFAINIYSKDFKVFVDYFKLTKSLGFEVAANLMYASKWNKNDDFFKSDFKLKYIDYAYVVDSFGGLNPSNTYQKIKMLKSKIDNSTMIGFHGHNNLELALANTISIINKIDIIDSTIMGMGRGAGNLKTELILTYLNYTNKMDLNFNILSEAVELFKKLFEKYRWGTNLPYMVSGTMSFPQKDVMELITKRFVSLNTIVNTISTKKKKLKKIEFKKYLSKSFLLIGGGKSVIKYLSDIKKFIKNNPKLVLLHSSARNLNFFNDIDNVQLLSIVGNEGSRFEKNFNDFSLNNFFAFIPKSPQRINIPIPVIIQENAYELPFEDEFTVGDSTHTSNVATFLKNINANQIFSVGYDGYNVVNEFYSEIEVENNKIFDSLKLSDINIISLTPSKYSSFIKSNIFYYTK